MNEPSRYVEPEITDARVERLWRGVAERLEPRPVRRVALVGVFFSVALAAAGGFVWLGADPPASLAPRAASAIQADAKLQTAADELSVTLSDGSSLALAKQSEVEVRGSKSPRVSLALGRGAVTCDVTHRDGRSFHVLAGDVEVRVVGTKFTVETDGSELPRVEVSVERGVVEVVSRRRPGVVARVGAGQSWIQSAEPAVSAQGASPRAVPPAPA